MLTEEEINEVIADLDWAIRHCQTFVPERFIAVREALQFVRCMPSAVDGVLRQIRETRSRAECHSRN